MRRVHATIGRILLFGILTAGACGLSCQPRSIPGLTETEAHRILSTYQEARNTANLDLLEQIIDAAVVVHDCSAPVDIVGLDSLTAFYQASHSGFPDFRISRSRSTPCSCRETTLLTCGRSRRHTRAFCTAFRLRESRFASRGWRLTGL